LHVQFQYPEVKCTYNTNVDYSTDFVRHLQFWEGLICPEGYCPPVVQGANVWGLIVLHSIVHSKHDYCNSLYYNLPKSWITRLQQTQNSLARAVVKAPKSCHIIPILHSLHWLNITERIKYKLLSLTYKVLTTTQPPYLLYVISVQPSSTRSSPLIISTTSIILITYN